MNHAPIWPTTCQQSSQANPWQQPQPLTALANGKHHHHQDQQKTATRGYIMDGMGWDGVAFAFPFGHLLCLWPQPQPWLKQWMDRTWSHIMRAALWST